jgi:hypothetical protein
MTVVFGQRKPAMKKEFAFERVRSHKKTPGLAWGTTDDIADDGTGRADLQLDLVKAQRELALWEGFAEDARQKRDEAKKLAAPTVAAATKAKVVDVVDHMRRACDRLEASRAEIERRLRMEHRTTTGK